MTLDLIKDVASVLFGAVALVISFFTLYKARLQRGALRVFPPSYLAFGVDDNGEAYINIMGTLHWTTDRGGFVTDSRARVGNTEMPLWYSSPDGESIEKASPVHIRVTGDQYDFLYYSSDFNRFHFSQGDHPFAISFSGANREEYTLTINLRLDEAAASAIANGRHLEFDWSAPSQNYILATELIRKRRVRAER